MLPDTYHPALPAPDQPEAHDDANMRDGAPQGALRCEKAPSIFGLVSIGDRLLGIEAVHLREAVPYPARLSPMALMLPDLIGAMVLREDTIPLIDVARMMSLESHVPLEQRVVIIVNDGARERLLGLVVDRLHDMTSVDLNSTAQMGVTGSADLMVSGRTFVHDGVVVGILDTQMLFERPGLPFAMKRSANEPADRPGTKTDDERLAYLLCSISGYGLGFPVRSIHATVPMTSLRSGPLVTGPCDGVIEYHDLTVPLLDTLRTLGLGQNFSRPERSASVALRVPSGGIAGLEIDRFFDIRFASKDELARVPQALTPRHDLFAGALIMESGDNFLLLDDDALLREGALVQFASTNAAQKTGVTETDAAENDGAAHGPSALYLLSLSAQKRSASPLEDIVEILPLPESHLFAEIRHDGFMGAFPYRGRLVPLFSVPTVLGDYPFFEEGKACILIFRATDQLFGAVVEQPESVVRCSPIGQADDNAVRELETGKLIPLYDFGRELPIGHCDRPAMTGGSSVDLF